MDERAKGQSGGCLTVAFWLAVSVWLMVGLLVVLNVSALGHVIDDAVGIGDEALYLVPMIVGSFGGAVYLSTRFENVPRVVMVSVSSLTALGVIALFIWG